VLLKPLILLFVSVFSVSAFADTQVRFLTGTKSQSFSNTSQEQVGSSPLGLIAFVDFELMEKWYFSLGTSFEFSTETFATSGFTLYGSGLYYLYGTPKKLGSQGEVSQLDMELYNPYSLYVNFGIFQKEVKLRRQGSTVIEDEGVGGLMFGLGGNYHLNTKTYLTGHVQYLQSGLGTELEFSSFEFYFGLGLRL